MQIPSSVRPCAWALSTALFVTGGGAPNAHAQQAGEEGADYGATARTEAPVASLNLEDATASGTTIELQDRRRALEDVQEVLVEVPGVRVLDAGGAGSSSVLSLRGAGAEHTSVLLGAIPLTTPDSGAFDLSTLPLAALDSVEVYRGGAPAWYSEGAIGGVVRFVPAQGQGSLMETTLGAGSFGRVELRATGAASGVNGARPAFFGHVRLLSAQNDYPFDPEKKNLVPGEPRELTQQNADILSGDTLLHGGVDALAGRMSFLFVGHGRQQGVPGPLAAPTKQMRRKLVQGLFGASWEREVMRGDGQRHYRVQLAASGSRQLNQVTDLGQELGVSRMVASNDVWSRGFVRAASSWGVLPFLEPALVLSFAADGYDPENLAAFAAPPRPSKRHTFGGALEARLHGRLFGLRSELRPSVRLAWNDTTIGETSGTGQALDSRQDFTPTYRLAAVIEPVKGLALSSSVASGVRLPSFGELFGDRALRLPNPALQPESSTTLDLSAVLRGRLSKLRGSVELRGFALWLDDIIIFERTSQYEVRPSNLDSGRILGLELGVGGQLGRHLLLSSALTAMDTRSQLDRALPMRPPLTAVLRPELQFFPRPLDDLRAFFEVQHVSFVYLDKANLTNMQGRTFLGLGGSVTFWSEHVSLEMRVNNLLDVRTYDLLARPLPPREFRIAITLRDSPGS